MKKTLLGASAILAAAALALTGCSSDPLAGSTDSGNKGDDSAASAELTPLKVVVAPIHFETTYIADREGFFEEEGLDVEIVSGADPTSNIARVVSGEVQITTGSLGTLITSRAAGVPVVGIAGNGYTSGDVATSGIITMKDSDIETVADLSGRTIAVQGLNTGSEIPLFLAAEDHDIDALSIERVEIASTGMETSLTEGTVDAVLASAPFYGQILSRDDVQLISNPSTEYMAGVPVTVWTSTEAWVADNEDTVESFVAAMQKAQDFYEDPANVDAVLDITAEVSDIDREGLTEAALIPVSVAINEKQSAVQADIFSKYELIKTPVKISEIFWSGTPRL